MNRLNYRAALIGRFSLISRKIMPVPKRKRSRARRDKRFANKALQIKTFTNCPNCEEAVMPHQVCFKCGHYKGRKIMVTKADRGDKRTEMRQAQNAHKAAAAPKEPASEPAE
jgi:large subunit ribosomal protein L32